MNFTFKFINREKELQGLQESFIREVIAGKKCFSYWVQGRLGVGKSRLIDYFIDSIEKDKLIHSKIPKFQNSLHVFNYSCIKDNKEPYAAFIDLTKQFEKQRQKFRILRGIGMLFISIFAIYDVIDALQKLGKEITTGESDEVVRAKETKIFTRYLRILKKRSMKAPIVIYIQNIQWLDDYSLKLLQTLVDDENSLWGMIILEEDEVGGGNKNVKDIFGRLADKGKISRLTVRALNKGFEIDILENLFEEKLFTAKEFEYIYTNSEGCPGKLEHAIKIWTQNGWLIQKGEKWEKTSGFEMKIKPPYQKLLELIINALEDRKINKKEEMIINNFAQEWDIGPDVVKSLIDMVLQSMDLGYEIEERVHSGSIGAHAFLAHDKDRNRSILEYISNKKNINGELYPLELKHPHLLPSSDVLSNQEGVFVKYDYIEGKNLKELHDEAHESRIMNVIQIISQIAEGVAELHRNGYVHGYLRPEAILKTDSEEIRVTSVDASKFNLIEPEDDQEYINYAAYFSPEKIDGKKLSPASDVFSIGVLFYEMIIGELPFTGKTKKEFRQSLLLRQIAPFDASRIPNGDEVTRIIETCLNKNPKDRYQNAGELVHDLRNLVTAPIQEETTITIEKKSESSPPKRKKLGLSLVALFLIAIISVIYFLFNETEKSSIKDVVVVNEFILDSNNTHIHSLKKGIIEYLVKDDLLQSSTLNVLSKPEFQFLYGQDKIPELNISGIIESDDIGIEISISLITSSGEKTNLSYKIFDPSALLTETISKITKEALNMVNIHTLKKSTFTKSWDAFINFYLGEKAWEKLDITKAKQFYKSALQIDPDFVLAKLRLARVLHFEGSNIESTKLIESIHPSLTLLSKVDSLKADALAATLQGQLMKEIAILRNIYNQFPSRKESPFDVAEAYYNICDIKNAINYYKKALHLDNNFAKAYNHLAYCYSHLGEHKKAIENFKKYVDLDGTANAYDSMGDGYMSAGKLDSAVWAKNKGVLLDPQLNYLYWALVNIYILKGEIKKAIENINKYNNFSYGNESLARSYYFKALIYYQINKYDSSLVYCRRALRTYDSPDPWLRNNDLHWLIGQVFLKLDLADSAQYELNIMEDAVKKNDINDMNYRMGIYKYTLHLKAQIAARKGDLATVIDIFNKFNGPLKSKIKDHSSPFDLAYFNTSFGEMFLLPQYNRKDLAIECFNNALRYNQNYPTAHYSLWKLYSNMNNETQAKKHLNIFKKLWKDADENIKTTYFIN